MGIKDFNKIEVTIDTGKIDSYGRPIKIIKKFKEYSEIVSYSDFAKEAVAIDAMNLIHRNINAAGGELLSNSQGKRTHHIYIAINQIILFIKNEICAHWVFDSGKVHPLKAETVEKRKKAAKKSGIYITTEEIEDIKKLLRLCGISYSTVDVEAEFYCAALSARGLVRGVISNDTDVIVAGGVLLTPISDNGKPKLCMLDPKVLREAANITQEEMYSIAALLGCDFCPKTRGVSPAIVLRNLHTVKFTERQEAAIEIFRKKLTKENIIERSESEPEKEELEKWLMELEFGIEIIHKLVGNL